MYTIKAETAGDAWVKTTKYLLENGNRVGNLYELLNFGIEIETPYIDPVFDARFREVFGDERIDYASSVTFVEPKTTESSFFDNELVFQQNDTSAKWNKTYWGRMIKWHDKFNQVEQTIKRLKEHKSAKTIVMAVYDPASDGRKTMSGMPCLLSVDCKPRDGKLHLTANFRSQAVTKSGYADYHALVKLNEFLCKQSGIEYGLTTSFAHSCHLRPDNDELKNSKRLLEIL